MIAGQLNKPDGGLKKKHGKPDVIRAGEIFRYAIPICPECGSHKGCDAYPAPHKDSQGPIVARCTACGFEWPWLFVGKTAGCLPVDNALATSTAIEHIDSAISELEWARSELE